MEDIKELVTKLFSSPDPASWKLARQICSRYRINYYLKSLRHIVPDYDSTMKFFKTVRKSYEYSLEPERGGVRYLGYNLFQYKIDYGRAKRKNRGSVQEQ